MGAILDSAKGAWKVKESASGKAHNGKEKLAQDKNEGIKL